MVGVEQAWLDGSVFPDCTVPGLALAVVIGGGMLVAAAITAVAGRHASSLVLAMGIVLLCVGAVETATLGYVGGARLALVSAFVAPGLPLTAIGLRGCRAAVRKSRSESA